MIDVVVASGETANVMSPADSTPVGEITASTPEDIERAVAAASKAFDTWRRVAPHERAMALRRGAADIRSRTAEIALLHTRESGKVIKQARKEIEGAAFILEENAHLARFDAGFLAPTGALPGGEQDLTIVERVPLGVVVCVIPFNFPVELTAEKAGAALAAGNAVVVKPPPQNPLATIAVTEAIATHLPDGLLTVISGGSEVSSALCAHPGVAAVSLTGSVPAGIAVSRATATMLRPLHLELGGNGAAIVCEDADLDLVVSETIRGRTMMNGQACAATKRLVVHRAIEDELMAALGKELAALTVGDPTEEDSDVGPLIDVTAASRVADQVANAVSQGGALLEGSLEATHAWFQPTLVAGLNGDADVARDDEIFGPVLSAIPYSDDQEATRIVNGSKLALTAAVFSRELPRAVEMAQDLNVGGVVINGTNNYRPPVVPFGGVGLAGSGREGIGYTYEEMTRTRFIAFRGLRPRGSSIQ